MLRSLNYTSYPSSTNYTEIVDVRSPLEFSEDRIPGAINLPVLDNEERVIVGKIYKQESPFKARKIGAALVAKNISNYLSNYLFNKDKDYKPLVYCWRGGQRSNSFALVLSQIGWDISVIEGGYKTYRAYVRQELSLLPQQYNYQIISGLTGTGKTYILRQLATKGLQILDLEKLANHRGSLFGEEWAEKSPSQPSQKWFESLLLQELQKFDISQTVWVESESNKIGKLCLPASLWDALKKAKSWEIQLPLGERVNWLLQQYPHLTASPDLLKSKLTLLKYRYSSKIIQQWYDLIDRKKWKELVENLLIYHYDPAYLRSLARSYNQVEKQINLPDLYPQNVDRAIELILSN